MRLLSNELIRKYDYQKTRFEVNKFMDRFEEIYFKYFSILPPSITSHISEVKVQSSRSSSSSLEKYVINTADLHEELLSKLTLVLKVVDTFTEEETYFFKLSFFWGASENTIMEKIKCSIKRIIHIKKSCVIKLALALDKAILK